jgi:hypothetical protein
VEGKLDRRRVEAAEGIRVGEIRHKLGQGRGELGESTGGISSRRDGVEIPHKERKNGGGGLDVGPQGEEEGLTGRTEELARGGVKMKERKGAHGHELAVARVNGGHRRARDAGEDGDGAVAEGGEESLVPTHAGQGGEGGRDADLLKKNKMRLVLAEKGGQAAEVRPLGGVEGEEGE